MTKGFSTGIVISEKEFTKYHKIYGEALWLAKTKEGPTIMAHDRELADTLRLSSEIMEEYAVTLKTLADN